MTPIKINNQFIIIVFITCRYRRELTILMIITSLLECLTNYILNFLIQLRYVNCLNKRKSINKNSLDLSMSFTLNVFNSSLIVLVARVVTKTPTVSSYHSPILKSEIQTLFSRLQSTPNWAAPSPQHFYIFHIHSFYTLLFSFHLTSTFNISNISFNHSWIVCHLIYFEFRIISLHITSFWTIYLSLPVKDQNSYIPSSFSLVSHVNFPLFHWTKLVPGTAAIRRLLLRFQPDKTVKLPTLNC